MYFCCCTLIKSAGKAMQTCPVLLFRMESKPELVKTEMGPPPSPASTCSDASSIASSASLPYSTSPPSCYLSLFAVSATLESWFSYLQGAKPISSSRCALISSLTLKQMVHRLLSATFFLQLVFLWRKCGQLTVYLRVFLWLLII